LIFFRRRRSLPGFLFHGRFVEFRLEDRQVLQHFALAPHVFQAQLVHLLDLVCPMLQIERRYFFPKVVSVPLSLVGAEAQSSGVDAEPGTRAARGAGELLLLRPHSAKQNPADSEPRYEPVAAVLLAAYFHGLHDCSSAIFFADFCPHYTFIPLYLLSNSFTSLNFVGFSAW